MKRLRLVLLICDWNGTLVDDEKRARTATNNVLRTFDRPFLHRAAFRAMFKLPLESFFADNGVPEPCLQEAVQAWNDQLARMPAPLRAGVHELLDAAAAESIPVGVISAARTDVVRNDAASLGVLPRLAFIHGDTADKTTLISQLVATTDGPVGYLGDTEHDMSAATNAGALPIAISGGYKSIAALKTAGAAITISDLRRLAVILVGPNGQTPGDQAEGS